MGGQQIGIQVSPWETERIWEAEGVPVLCASACLPRPPEERQDRVSRRIRRYYSLQQRAFLRRCETVLLPQARQAARAALETSGPLPCFRAELSYQVTLERDGLWSLCTQLREQTDHGPTQLTRWGDTWDLSTGYPVPLSHFFPQGTAWKKQALSAIREAMEAQERAGVARYREGWQRELRRRFNPRSFYLTDDGLCLFYAMYALGPAAEGIPSFTLPYGPQGPLERPL